MLGNSGVAERLTDSQEGLISLMSEIWFRSEEMVDEAGGGVQDL
jgi:hypothetical protein